MRNLKSFVAHHDPTIDILLRKPRSILYRPFSTFLWFTNYYLKGIKGFFKVEGSHSGLVRALGKRVRGNSLREFESLTLRQSGFRKPEEAASLRSAANSYCFWGEKEKDLSIKIWFEPICFRNVAISDLSPLSNNLSA